MASDTTVPVSQRPALAGIGERLREMFDAMTSGSQADHLVDLVDQLEAQAGGPAVPAERLSPA